ncbi:MAG: S-layer homology domain-containing protein, partial [Oscillospiraceae bacterium]|nr:S-layer homology domain-containing protein [Oscillospiraceae bacterium]
MRKFLALVLALVMTMSLVTVSAGAATDFTDDAKITNAEAVEVLSAIGILGGYADGSFRPEGVLTRGAGAKMVAYLMLGQEAADDLKATYTVFEDVTDTVGLAPYIEWAAANGIVGGYGNGKFGPYDTLTQYAFGKMLLTAIGYD